jgi:hypothetical protein
MTIYTVGYNAGWTPEILKSEAERLGAVVADIRYSPRSRRPQWSKKRLLEILGQDYIHIRELGNSNYKGSGPIELVSTDVGLDRLHAIHRSVILLCACRELSICHRGIVAVLARDRFHWPVEHLNTAPRASPEGSRRRLAAGVNSDATPPQEKGRGK